MSRIGSSSQAKTGFGPLPDLWGVIYGERIGPKNPGLACEYAIGFEPFVNRSKIDII